jgi:hypothetical protein
MHLAYINTETLEYPVHEGDIRLVHPEIDASLTGETFIAPFPFAPVIWTESPSFDPMNQIAEQTFPASTNGVWVAQWIVRSLTPQEKEVIDRLAAEREEQKRLEAEMEENN